MSTFVPAELPARFGARVVDIALVATIDGLLGRAIGFGFGWLSSGSARPARGQDTRREAGCRIAARAMRAFERASLPKLPYKIWMDSRFHHSGPLSELAVLGIALALVACDSSTGTSSSGATSSSTSSSSGSAGGGRDITDAVFTERSGDCGAYADRYVATVEDIQQKVGFEASVEIVADASSCSLTSNAIPNHDFDDATAAFATKTKAIEKTFVIPRFPVMAGSSTALGLQTYDAVMLNGVVVDLLAAGCFGVGDGKIGCSDLATPWRYDPMSPTAGFGTDAHNAHTQPDGRYHYHGDPLAMYGDSTVVSPVIGFAADGYPIYGPYFDDGGRVRAAVSGYTLRAGARPTGASDPGGDYDGTFVDDYEYTAAGDLDECNGMTIDGQYGYYVTRGYPWVLACLRGTPDASFNKQP